MNLVLAHHHRLRPEALDDRAHMRTDRRRGDQHRQMSGLGGTLEGALHPGDELLQLGRRHGQMPVVAIAMHGLGETALPVMRQRDDRQRAVRTEIGGAQLPGEPATHMFGHRLWRAAGAGDLGNAFQDCCKVAD